MQLKQTIPIALAAALAYAQDDSDSGSGSSGMMVCPRTYFLKSARLDGGIARHVSPQVLS